MYLNFFWLVCSILPEANYLPIRYELICRCLQPLSNQDSTPHPVQTDFSKYRDNIDCAHPIWYFQLFYISKSWGLCTTMVGIHIKEHKARFAQHDASYCEMLIYHCQLSVMVLPEDQQECWNINSLAAAVTLQLDEFKSRSSFKARQ